MLDVLSGGRLVAGFPVGSSMDTTFAYGQVPQTLRDKYDEAYSLVMQAWTRPEVFAFNGKYTQLRYVNIWPRPLQQPHPPIWIPGGGSVETWDWTAERDHVYCYLSYYGYKRAESIMAGYWERMQELGKDLNPYRGGFLQLVAVAESDAAAERDYATHADYFYNRCLHVYPGFADAPGYRSVKTLQKGLVATIGGSASKEREQYGWKEFVEHGYVVAGSPSSVVDQLKDVIKRLRVGHLMVLLQFGDMPRELAMKNTELFGREVLPKIHDTWPEWTDHWYPRGARSIRQAEPVAAAQ